MSNKIPTARSLSSGIAEAKRMIEFAQLHVEAALKAAAEKAEGYNEGSEGNDAFVDKQSILNAYPKENIK